jgi:hypothetical protein
MEAFGGYDTSSIVANVNAVASFNFAKQKLKKGK